MTPGKYYCTCIMYLYNSTYYHGSPKYVTLFYSSTSNNLMSKNPIGGIDMQRVKLVSLSLLLGIIFSTFPSTFSYSKDEGMTTLRGNVVCLLPDFKNGTVQPVIATSPCSGLPQHNHVLVTNNAVYSLQGLDKGLMKIEQSSKRTNVKISGKVKGNKQTGWILFVD